MTTREEIAAIDRECEEQHISLQYYLESHGIAKHQYYSWKHRYREEDEQSLVPAGFVPMMPGSVPVQSIPTQKPRGKQHKLQQDQESFLTVEIRTSSGSVMRIQGNMTAAHLREIISASIVESGRHGEVLSVQQASGHTQELQRPEGIVTNGMCPSLRSGDVYIFMNARRNMMKLSRAIIKGRVLLIPLLPVL